jgi:hypothetical protein
MRRLMKAGFIWSGLLWSFFSYGQALEAPLGALPMQYNSSFAGEAGGPRFSSSFTLQPRFKLGTGHSYELYTAYDQFIPAIRSGIGVMVGRGGTLSSSSYSYANQLNKNSVKGNDYLLSVSVAPKFSIQGKYTLSPSIDFTHMQGNTLVINETEGPSFANSSYSNFQSQYWQSRIGLLFNTNKYYIGYSIAVLSRGMLVVDDQQKTNSTTTLDTSNSYRSSARFLSYLQAGYSFQRTSQSKFSFTPQVMVRIGNNSSFPYRLGTYRLELVDINLNFKYQQFIFGVNNQGVHVGWQTDKIRLMLSNKYAGYRGYVGNLSFRYLIKHTSGKSPNLASGN